jgi:hypothetical protein
MRVGMLQSNERGRRFAFKVKVMILLLILQRNDFKSETGRVTNGA